MWPVMSKIFPDADRTPRHDLTDHCDGPADLNPGTLVLGGADGCIMFAAQGLLDWPGEERRCPRGDLNPHALIRALAPQASASANSAPRTSAQGTLATARLVDHIGNQAHPGAVDLGRTWDLRLGRPAISVSCRGAVWLRWRAAVSGWGHGRPQRTHPV